MIPTEGEMAGSEARSPHVHWGHSLPLRMGRGPAPSTRSPHLPGASHTGNFPERSCVIPQLGGPLSTDLTVGGSATGRTEWWRGAGRCWRAALGTAWAHSSAARGSQTTAALPAFCPGGRGPTSCGAAAHPARVAPRQARPAEGARPRSRRDGRAESSSGSRLVSRSAAGPGWVGSRCPSRPRPRRTQPRAPAEQGGLNVPAPGCAEAAQT